MILTCPECGANFLVPDNAVPLQGREVRCGACKHQWLAMPGEPKAATADFAALRVDTSAMIVADDAAATTATAVMGDVAAGERDFQLPAIAKKPLPSLPFLIAMPVLAILWFITAFYANYPGWLYAPGVKAVYKALGVRPTDGLRFSRATLAREEEAGRTRFVISGIIANESSYTRVVPSVQVRLLDEDQKEVASRIYVVNVTLSPGATYPFRITNLATNFGERVEEVVLDVGHDFQLLFR